ncbi:MAG TPA: hypothetical protein VES79_14820 [Solirubrobacteraceae bacterium]|nr:hypothetical protein [Solirubrobacteraceae bacterium]
MTATAPETSLPARLGGLVTCYGLLVVLLAGALLLIVAEFMTLYEIRAVTAVPEGGTTSVGGHHAYALLIVGVALVPIALGAVRGGSRPAAVAVLALALVAAGIVALVDLPDLNETGLIGRTYDEAEARPRAGFLVESLGATLVLVGAVATLLFRRR